MSASDLPPETSHLAPPYSGCFPLVSCHMSHIAWHRYHITVIKQTFVQVRCDAGNLFESLLLEGLSSHSYNALWVAGGQRSSFCQRSHHCGELTADHVGQSVRLCGWVQHQRMGKFLTIRDSHGVTQVLLDQAQVGHLVVNNSLTLALLNLF